MKLIKHPDPILKQPATPWQFQTDDDFKQAAHTEQQMLSLMKASNGIGLAAQQVGLLKRVFVMRTQDGRECGLFNPVILEVNNKKAIGDEGCLSYPDLWLKVERSTSLIAKYLDNAGIERIIQLEGLDARCFLHELDHLDGICFTDGLSPLKLSMAIKKQRKLNGRTK
jgi:peptide deformylase